MTEAIEIGIVDTRNILKLLLEQYQYDFSDFSLISLKRRIEQSIQLHSMRYADALLSRLNDDKSFFDQFLHELQVETTEMFRDPSLWRVLRDEYLQQLEKPAGNAKIWLPNCVSGDELYTLCIVLHEYGLSEKVQVIAGYQSDYSLKHIQSGFTRSNILEISGENYKRYQGKNNFPDYFIGETPSQRKNPGFFEKVQFIRHGLNLEDAPRGVDLILFRNKMIYYNPPLAEKICGTLWDSLNPSGYLVVGIKELVPQGGSKPLKLVNEHESIYQKK